MDFVNKGKNLISRLSVIATTATATATAATVSSGDNSANKSSSSNDEKNNSASTSATKSSESNKLHVDIENNHCLRFVFKTIRNPSNESIIQLKEIKFFDSEGIEIKLSNDVVSVANPNGNSPTDEQCHNIIKSNDSKWLDFNFGPSILQYNFNKPLNALHQIESYQFYTANDCIHRDPTAWSCEVSVDGGNTWTTLSEKSGVVPPTNRYSPYDIYFLDGNVSKPATNVKTGELLHLITTTSKPKPIEFTYPDRSVRLPKDGLKRRQGKIVPPGHFSPLIMPVKDSLIKVTASAVQVAGVHRDDNTRFERFGAHKAIDGNLDSFWGGGKDSSETCWLALDLGRICSSHSLKITLGNVQESTSDENGAIVNSPPSIFLDIQGKVDGTFCTVKRFLAKNGENIVHFFAVFQEFRILQSAGFPGERGMAVYDVELFGWEERPCEFIHPKPPRIFFSYQWDAQPLVTRLKRDIEEAIGVSCWVDIVGMGAGNDLLLKIADGIQSSDVVIHMFTKKYTESINCGKEVFLTQKFQKASVILKLNKDIYSVPADHWMMQAKNSEEYEITWDDSPDIEPANQVYFSQINGVIDYLINVLSDPSFSRTWKNLPANRPDSIVVSDADLEQVIQPDIGVTIPRKLKNGLSDNTNFALFRPCRSTGNYIADSKWADVWKHFRAASVTDGKPNTRWSGAKDGQGNCWITVDLGCTVDINLVKVRFEAAYASVYRIDLQTENSDDWSIGEELYGGEDWFETTMSNSLARRLRVFLLYPRWTGAGMSIWNLEVFGRSFFSPTPELFVIWEDLEHNTAGQVFDEIESSLFRKAFVNRLGKTKWDPSAYINDDDSEIANQIITGPLYSQGPDTLNLSRLRTCEVVFVAGTKETLSSPNCVAAIVEARKMNKRIVPLLFDADAEWPIQTNDAKLDIYLKKILYVDFRGEDKYAGAMGLVLKLWHQ